MGSFSVTNDIRPLVLKHLLLLLCCKLRGAFEIVLLVLERHGFFKMFDVTIVSSPMIDLRENF